MVKNASALTRHARCSVVESTESRERDNISVLSGLDEASPGRITVERHVGPVVVVVARIRAHASQQMELVEDDEVIDNFAPERSDEPLDVPVLPRRARRDAELRDAEMAHASIERRAVDPVAVANQRLEAFVRDSFDDLLRGPFGSGMRRHVDVKDPTTFKGGRST